MPETPKHTLWAGIAKQAVSFVIGIVVAAFIFGRSAGDLRQKVNDVVQWKAEAGPRIERMDRGGSISFENFKTNYEIEQSKQYKRLEKLEDHVGHLETMTLRIERLEKKMNPDP